MEKSTHTINAPGCVLTYDIRRNPDSGEPPLMLIGSPMGASGFEALIQHFPERTIVTYDPRGAERSTKDDPASLSNPGQHSDDLHRIISEVGGPVDMFASSGGAVNALALVAAHPDDVRILVAHEPPLAALLPDAENAKTAVLTVRDAYQQGGFGKGMAQFIAITGHTGEFPDDFAEQPAADPAMFGMPPTEDNGDRTDVLMHQNIIGTTHYQPDFDALKAAPTRIIMAAGEESQGQMANRGAYAVAERLGQDVVVFPSHHGGFVGGEYGWAGQPESFAVKLHEVLSGVPVG